jgi:hypothetical protein
MIGRLRTSISLAVLALGAGACTPHIGGSCSLNTDCSIDNSKQCDNSQPNGYCTVFNCAPNACPDNAVCVELQANVPGCPYDDYASPSRSGRSLCLKACNQDSDCRQSEGYACKSMMQLGLSGVQGVILDDNQSQSVCVVPSAIDAGTGSLTHAPPVCPGAPASEAGSIPVNDSGAGLPDGQADAGDASVDVTVADAPSDVVAEEPADAVSDAPADATVDGGDTGVGDAAADAAAGG